MTADTHQGDLPPLPPTSYVLATEGDGYSNDSIWPWAGYDEDAMREYGRACVAAALQGRAQEGEPSDAVEDAMAGYLRVCSCGGMPKKEIDLIKRHISEAKRLGYFDRAALAQDSRVSVEIREAM